MGIRKNYRVMGGGAPEISQFRIRSMHKGLKCRTNAFRPEFWNRPITIHHLRKANNLKCAQKASSRQEVERKVAAVQQHFETWLNYQALWDMDLGQVYNLLGTNLANWLSLVGDIRRARQVRT